MLIEDCIVRDASDAGIYVGQSRKHHRPPQSGRENVAGIEIENSVNADVYENIATDNTGGILVFSLPDLPQDRPPLPRLQEPDRREQPRNFAPEGNIVGMVPPGTGVMILANRHVEVFDNTFQNNQNVSLSICELPGHREAL